MIVRDPNGLVMYIYHAPPSEYRQPPCPSWPLTPGYGQTGSKPSCS